MFNPSSTIIDVFSSRVWQLGERPAFIFSDGDDELGRLSFVELDRDARMIGAHLQRLGLFGERVLLLFDSGRDFIRSFFGCLYAGAVAVPVSLPTQRARVDKLRAIARNAGARLALTSSALGAELVAAGLPLPYVNPSELSHSDTASFHFPKLQSDSPAFLQYTSGSTGNPKGVLVSHGNLLSNQRMIQEAFAHDESTVVAGWLPLYHDMGLVGNVLQPVFLGVPCALMPPVAFVQKPVRWLRLISRYRATTSGAPNFAYELCLQRIADHLLADIDLSSWRLAFNGAEPIRASTLERFAARFASLGFRPEALYPCYGMAEATLFISGGSANEPPTLCNRPASLASGTLSAPDAASAERLVGCGYAWGEQQIAIVDPESCEELPPGSVGEIWVSGPNVAQGYWMDPEATQATFAARTRDGRGPFLRTGDLGFVAQRELVVTGRRKDLIIVAGRNHYPQDIERTVGDCHPAFEGRPGAAFATASDDGEQLAVVQEVGRRYCQQADIGSVLRECIREAVAREHGLRAEQIVLLKPGALPITTSGKVQRSLCRERLAARAFVELFSSSQPAPPSVTSEQLGTEASVALPSRLRSPAEPDVSIAE